MKPLLWGFFTERLLSVNKAGLSPSLTREKGRGGRGGGGGVYPFFTWISFRSVTQNSWGRGEGVNITPRIYVAYTHTVCPCILKRISTFSLKKVFGSFFPILLMILILMGLIPSCIYLCLSRHVRRGTNLCVSGGPGSIVR